MAHPRDLRLLVGAVGVSALGDFLALIPLALYLQDGTGSGLVVAALFIALWGPSVLLAAVAGLVADRVETRRLIIVVSLVQAAIAVALAFSGGSTAAILTLAALLGSANAIAQPAEFALVPAVAGEERLARANGHVETARYVGMTLGPLLGAALAAGGGTRIALLADAATFVVVALAAAALHARRHPVPAVAGAPADRARDGIVFLLADRALRLVMVVAFASLLFMSATVTAEVFFATDVLDAGQLGYGLLMAAWMLGMAAGATLVAPRVRPDALVGGALVAIAVQGLGLAVPTLWLLLGFALAGYVVGGVAHGAKNVLVRTLIHERVPDALRGRAFAAYNGLRNGAELFALAGGGLLVATLGARWTLLVAGGGAVVAGLLGLAVRRRAPRTLPGTPARRRWRAALPDRSAA